MTGKFMDVKDLVSTPLISEEIINEVLRSDEPAKLIDKFMKRQPNMLTIAKELAAGDDNEYLTMFQLVLGMALMMAVTEQHVARAVPALLEGRGAVTSKLNLTDEQKAKLKDLWDKRKGASAGSAETSEKIQ